MRTKIRVALAVAAASALALATPAAAHVTVSPESAAADEFAHLDFSVGHGCEGSPTTRVRVRIPESVPSVTPQVHPGWSTRTEEGPKEETELHGETITEGVSEVIWRAQEQPLPDDRLAVFGMSVRLPAGEGETLHFPTIQECEEGVHRWIEIPAEGEDAGELEEPAPALTLTTAEADEHGGSSADSDDGGSGAEATTVDAGQASASDDSDDGAPMGLAVLGIVLGGLGLLTGGASLIRSRGNGG